MRIVAGKWADTALVSPAGRVRPTSEGLRVLSMELIADEIADARVLDLFAGTGALGLEALSRGARSCDFVENHPSALHALKANVAKVRAPGRTRIFKRDGIPFVERLPAGAYDLAFADPPYQSRKLDRVLARWLAAPFSPTLVVEHAADRILPARGVSRRLEDSVVTVLRARTSDR
ncbi:MAG: RsmD family RNA methyltransferase [Longimicrobiales bacterium]